VFLVVIYLAVEPYVRRHVPELLIGWARVLEGRLRDPRVGRDVLVGALLGTVAAVTIHLVNGMPSWFEVPGQTTMPPNYDVLRGGRFLLGALFNAPFGALGPGLFFFGLYFLLRVIARRPAIATTLLVVIGTLTALGGENAMVETPGAVVFGILMALTVTRFGLLAIVVFALFQQVLTALPMPLDFAAPYAASSLIVLLLLIGIAVYAFRIALGSRPVFRMALDA
jgi:hypothetical protein